MPDLSYRDAIREALIEEMTRDESIVSIGQDLIPQGGSFGVHKDLDEMFPGRLLQTPISEAAIGSLAVGYALCGSPVVAEIMFSDFMTCCMDEIVNQAAKIRYMSGGQAALSVVFRSPSGTAKNIGAQHSQSFESWFAHTPGLVVALPATPADAKGMLKSALRGNDPVVFLESKMLYADTGPVPEGEHLVPLGKAAVAREGTDATIVAIGRMRKIAIAAADVLAEDDGIEVEIVDPRTVSPMDWDTIFASVEKTGRVLVVEEAPGHCSVGAEIAASISEFRFLSLDLPVRRLSAPHVPKPFTPQLEDLTNPRVEDVVRMVREMVNLESF